MTPPPTSQPKRPALAAPLFVLFLGVCLLSLTSPWPIDPLTGSTETYTADDVITGKTRENFEKSLEKHLPYKPIAIHLWSSLRYLLFHSGSDGVVIGKEGWLFTTGEFELTDGYKANLEQNYGLALSSLKCDRRVLS